MISAKELREQNTELEFIENKILRAAKRGEHSVLVNKFVSTETQKELEKMGYKVENNNFYKYAECIIKW